MESRRSEIMPGVWFTRICGSEFTDTCVSINFLSQLQRETAAQYALIPYVLACGSSQFKTGEALKAKATELGGVTLEPAVRKFGEIQSVGMKMTVPAGADIVESCRFLCSVIFSPSTKGGLLIQKYVDEQKQLLADISIDNEEDDLIARCISEMCCYEDYSTPVNGAASDLSSIYYKKLTRAYQELLQTAPVEIMVCSPSPDAGLRQLLRDELAVMPRGEINYDLGTDIRMNSVAESLRIVTDDEATGTECAFALGCRIGEYMDDPDFAGMEIASELIILLVSSLENYRDVTAHSDFHKGILVISGICPKASPDKLSEDIRSAFRKAYSPDFDTGLFALSQQKADERISSICSDSSAAEDFFMSGALLGVDFSPEELALIIRETALKDVCSVLHSIEFDLICINTIV